MITLYLLIMLNSDGNIKSVVDIHSTSKSCTEQLMYYDYKNNKSFPSDWDEEGTPMFKCFKTEMSPVSYKINITE